MLLARYSKEALEAGCDEAGRGPLAGPVFAAAVIFPPDYRNARLDDSKKLSPKVRCGLQEEIMRDAVSYAVAQVDEAEIDRINILQAAIKAMHMALARLQPQPTFITVDGNRFRAYGSVPHVCVVKGDGKYLSIAAASILAKNARDEHMLHLHGQCPLYGWDKNKGYPTKDHYDAILKNGPSPWHRRSFKLYKELELF